MARILYISLIWEGIEEALLHPVEAKGMPGFIKPLQAALQRGHEVDFIFAGDASLVLKPNTAVFGPGRMVQVPWSNRLLWLPREARRLAATISSLLKARHYDFVYAHSQYIGAVANLVANLHHVPFGLRCYGTFLAAKVEDLRQAPFWLIFKPLTAFRVRDLLEALTYRLHKQFYIVTDDGSKADVLFRLLGCRRYQWCFWRNGVTSPRGHLTVPALEQYGLKHDENYVVYPARFQDWKRQERMIEILARLKKRHLPAIKVLFAGQVSPPAQSYHDRVMDLARSLGVAQQVIHLGALSPTELQCLYTTQNCLCVASLYDRFNLGNAILEAFASSAIVLSYRQSGLDWLVDDGRDGFLVGNLEEASTVIARLAADHDLRGRVRQACAKSAKTKLESWDQRAQREVDLIERSVRPPRWRMAQSKTECRP